VSCGRPRPARFPSRPRSAVEGVFVTGTGTEVGKTVVAAAIARTEAARGRRVAVFKPALTGLDDPGEPDHALLRRAAGSAQSDEQIAPYRYGPPASPHLAAALAGEEIDPDRLRSAAAEAAAAADCLVCEGVGGLLVPLTPSYLVRDFARDLGLPLAIAASPGLGTINHTLLTVDAARAAGLEVAMVVLTPWPESPSPVEKSNLETIASVARIRPVTLPRLDLRDPGSWLALPRPPRG
jgi:dethiobiotin synthetase